jgi:hypothetical protein
MLARPAPARRRLTLPVVGWLVFLLTVGVLAVPAHAAKTTPRDFTGYGFDQCLAPTQSAMDAWLQSSPYWAVGIYISGASRACRSQPNLTPAWIKTQLKKGWRLLPITLGPQASCSTRFPRYGNDPTINPSSTNNYAAARNQGRAEAVDAVATAKQLGIKPGSTLWYDMEAYDHTNTHCRESALFFTSAWTWQLHQLGYVSGVYSSAGSGLKALDDARVQRPKRFNLPDQIWIARWDGVANTSTSYLRSDGWLHGGRMKQYLGDHYETHGGVRINIDSNWLDLGKGRTAKPQPELCGGVRINFRKYKKLASGATGRQVRAAQCLLQLRGYYQGPVEGVMDADVLDAVVRWRGDHKLPTKDRFVGARVWMQLHYAGRGKLMKVGALNEPVRRLQRALNAGIGAKLPVTGWFDPATAAAVKRYQARVGMPQTGVVTKPLWDRLERGTL